VRRTLLALLIALSAASAPLFAAEDPFPHVAQAYLVRVQGETLWARHADARLPPASLTKIMTALLVLESYQPQAVITVSPAVAAETGARLALRRICDQDLRRSRGFRRGSRFFFRRFRPHELHNASPPRNPPSGRRSGSTPPACLPGALPG